MADRKEEEAVVISVEDLARTLIDTNKFLETNTRGALDVPGIIPLLRDARSGVELLRELGLNGRYYTKEINGRTYVILRGYAGLRKVLSASRYLPTNPKVITYGLTRAAAAAEGALNVIITIVVLVPLEIIRHLMGEQTLSQVFGNVLKGTMVAALSSAASIGAASVLALMNFPVCVVVGGAIVAGLLVSMALDQLGVASSVSGFISIALDKAVQHWAEDEARKARGQRILGQFYHDNPGPSPWRGLILGRR
ncbi:hypothetical protein [Inquilinus sp. Marseille-Q2685]|uniref:hypothetical protein n=1 Tax=Inquilinus sp. Marseille-Q2685 TaxID=2866581 RepID=UPI001CE4A073|nr:hypothetical protein [Inquilinus sp. Marseille-Q2685]